VGFARTGLKSPAGQACQLLCRGRSFSHGLSETSPSSLGFGVFSSFVQAFSPLKIQQMFAVIRRTPNLAFPSLRRERNIFTIVFLKKAQGKRYFYLFQ